MYLKINKAKISDNKLIIEQFDIVDQDSQEMLRIASITPELVEFLMTLQIDITNYIKVKAMIDKNPELSNLINKFKLWS